MSATGATAPGPSPITLQRAGLRTLNASFADGQTSSDRLDGSLKKTTAFKAKLKAGVSADTCAALKKDVLTLKLDKFLEEIVLCFVDSINKLSKPQDLWAAVDLCSLIHRRHPSDFADLLKPAILKTLKELSVASPTQSNSSTTSADAKEREEVARISRLKPLLRFFAELCVVGVLPDEGNQKRTAVANSLLVNAVNFLFNANSDKDFANVSVAASFCKSFTDVIFPDNDYDHQPFVENEISTAIKGILLEYNSAVSKYLVKMHKFIKKAEISNYEHAVARGEISEERQERYARAQKTYSKLLANVTALSASLNVEMIALPEVDSGIASKLTIGISYSGSKEIADDQEALLGGPWEDEESRAFYEDVIDLKDFVPTVLLGDKQEKRATLTAAELENLDKVIKTADISNDSNTDPSEFVSDKLDESLLPEEGEELDEMPTTDESKLDDPKEASTNSRAAVDAFFTALPNALSVEAIDKLATEFCYVNTKTSRKKLVAHLLSVPRQRLDILPYYSRLIAVLSPFMPEIASNVISTLEKQFHFHQKKGDRTFVEEKIKVVRFIGELTKFKLPPYHVIFHVFKVLLESFTPHNIECVCSLLETCGRFLYKTPETSMPTGHLLEILMKKKSAFNLDSRLNLLIDNAFYECNPPERSVIEQKQRTPLEMYIRKLFYSDLSKKTCEKVLQQVRKLNWNDEKVLKLATKPFLKPWKLHVQNIQYLAYMTHELSSRFYSSFGIRVVDECLEDIRRGLETNLFKDNQRRLIGMKFLGELFNYKVVESGVIFDTLYLVLRFGYESPFPEFGVTSPLDAGHDFFRVRLCCLLLETCGQWFDGGSLGRKLNEFLAFMLVYIRAKPMLPMDVRFLVEETLEVLGRVRSVDLSSSNAGVDAYDAAVDAFNLLVTDNAVGGGGGGSVGGDSDARSALAAEAFVADDDDEDEWAGRPVDPADGDKQGGDDTVADGLASARLDDDINDDDPVVVVMSSPAVANEEEEAIENDLAAEFEKEFSKMMQESLDSRKHEKKNASAFDIAVPVKRGVAFQNNGQSATATDGVVFSFLTKRGNKQQVKNFELPQNSELVLSTKLKQEAELEERKQLKRLVLNYEDREHDGAEQTTAGTSSRATVTKGKKVLISIT
ncbi:hypothetical protein HDU84_004011 [Entophlyctis sp. JEL0112]|nr:hypothetical protein HDU84_004011 [Entophlyctis sp. JEL0112]